LEPTTETIGECQLKFPAPDHDPVMIFSARAGVRAVPRKQHQLPLRGGTSNSESFRSSASRSAADRA
jgi:hypothetical protein